MGTMTSVSNGGHGVVGSYPKSALFIINLLDEFA
jgi:hypothetical protein